MHGAVTPSALAEQYQNMDAFLICYDIIKDQSKGTNYHKILEFLSTGKVVISNNVSTYEPLHLLEMSKSRTSNQQLFSIFTKVIGHLEDYNSEELMNLRKEYAFANSYKNHISAIGGYIE